MFYVAKRFSSSRPGSAFAEKPIVVVSRAFDGRVHDTLNSRLDDYTKPIPAKERNGPFPATSVSEMKKNSFSIHSMPQAGDRAAGKRITDKTRMHQPKNENTPILALTENLLRAF